MTTMTKRSDEVTARHAELIAEANEALDRLGPLTPGDLIRPFVEWLHFLLEVSEAVQAVGFPQSIDTALNGRATELSRMLDRAGDLVSMYTESHITETGVRVAGLHARSVFEAVTGAPGLRRDLLDGDAYYSVVEETARTPASASP